MEKEDLRLRVWLNCNLGEEGSTHVLAYDINDKKMLESECSFFSTERRVGEFFGFEECWDLEEDLIDFIEILSEYKYKCEDVFETEHLDPDDHEVKEALQKAYVFINSFKLKEVYRHKETGELLDMSLYEKEVIVDDK